MLKFDKQREKKEREARRVPKKRKGSTPESTLQAYAEGLLKAMGIPYLRLSTGLMSALFGGGGGKKGYHCQLAKELKGWPDIMAFKQVSEKYSLVLWLELKTDIGKLRQSQKNRNAELGYVYQVATTEKEIDEIIKEFNNCST